MGLDSVSGQETFGEEMWPLKGLASSESDFELIPEDTEEVEVDHPPAPAAWKVRRRRGFKRRRTDLNDGKAHRCQLSVADLKYSQLSIKDRFQCGRTVRQLIRGLWFGSIKVTAPFLRLTVFETTDRKTGRRILRCIDNRRLFALKEFAGMTGEDDLMVTVNLYSQTTIMQVLRFIQNTDDTPGDHVHLRRQKTFR